MPLFIALAVSLGSFSGYILNDKEIPQTAYHAVADTVVNALAEEEPWRSAAKRMKDDAKALDAIPMTMELR